MHGGAAMGDLARPDPAAVRRGLPKYSSALSDMVAQPRAATVMGLMEEARQARIDQPRPV